jgi:hypothetical protein
MSTMKVTALEETTPARISGALRATPQIAFGSKHFRFKALSVLALATMGIVSSAEADVNVYQNTTTEVSVWVFNGANTIGNGLAANIDINELTLAAGSAGESITFFTFIANNGNATAVVARPLFYFWAADGANGNPGTLLAAFALSNQTFAAGFNTITATVPGGLVIPSSMVIWAGIGYDNGNGTSPITATQLNALGAPSYHPATVGTDGPQAFFLPPGSALTNPAVIPFGAASQANYGWLVAAAALVQPGACVSFPVNLAAPAGPNGEYVTLTSSDPLTVTFENNLNPIIVFIPAGSTTPAARRMPQVCGVNFGEVTVTESAGGVVYYEQAVVVHAALSFYPASVTVTTSMEERLTLTLSTPVPAGGVTVNLSSDNPGVATVPPTVTIPANGVSVIVPVTGVASGSTLIHANALPNVPDITASVTVQ